MAPLFDTGPPVPVVRVVIEVSVTSWPAAAGFGDADIDVVVSFRSTFCEVVPLLGPCVASPL
jgi:hypothetical protein